MAGILWLLLLASDADSSVGHCKIWHDFGLGFMVEGYHGPSRMKFNDSNSRECGPLDAKLRVVSSSGALENCSSAGRASVLGVGLLQGLGFRGLGV